MEIAALIVALASPVLAWEWSRWRERRRAYDEGVDADEIARPDADWPYSGRHGRPKWTGAALYFVDEGDGVVTIEMEQTPGFLRESDAQAVAWLALQALGVKGGTAYLSEEYPSQATHDLTEWLAAMEGRAAAS